jgi:Bacterial Ig-like domain (group 3)
VMETITPAAPTATTAMLVISAAAASSGAPVTFTATITSSTSGTPTGTVTFLDGAAVLGTGMLNGSGVASFTTSTLAVGTHSITAKYYGSANFAGSTSAAVMETITPAAASATTTALVSSAASTSSGAPVTFTATIKSSTSGTPTGTVTFLDGTIALGTGTLSGSGVASFTTSTLAVGTHSITAAYGGDSNFAASTSTVMSQIVLAPSFGLSGSPSSSTVSAGNPASFQIMVTGKNNFSSAVALSCSAGLPTGASCAFSPASVTPGTAPASSTLMISTQPHTTALLLPFSGGRKAPVFAAWLLVPAVVFGLLGLAVPRRRLRLGYALGLLLAGCVLWQSGCAGNVSGTTGRTTGGTPAGTYPVTVTGSVGTAQQTASVTLVVQ